MSLTRKEHDGPDRLFVEGLSHAGGMAHEDVFLKAAGILPGNGHIAQRPETGGDTVNGPALGNPALDQRPSPAAVTSTS
jgi:hypothetical protein